jgi:hypothetical protein
MAHNKNDKNVPKLIQIKLNSNKGETISSNHPVNVVQQNKSLIYFKTINCSWSHHKKLKMVNNSLWKIS